MDPGIDLGSDVAKLGDKLKALATERNRAPATLTIEIDGKLLHAYVVQLLDVSVRAGFPDVAAVPIDRKQR